QATEIVRGMAGRYEKHHRVAIRESAVVSCVQLAKRYVPDRFLPESALDLLDENSAARRVQTDGITPELDAARTELASLQAQHASISSAEDERSVEKREQLATRIAELEPEVQAAASAIEARREAVDAVRALSRELAEAEQQ